MQIFRDLPAIVPRPVSLIRLDGPGVELDAGSAIVIRSLAPEEQVRGVAGYLADVLRPATGFALPIRLDAPDREPSIELDATGPASIELDLTGPASLGREGYRLTTHGSSRVLLQAHTAEGLFRGVQTLRQLLPARIESPGPQPGPWIVPAVDVTDRPRFGYRASMLDVGRRFVATEDVKRFIDLCARYKMNVFHWHLTEDQGWRLPSRAYPELNEAGAATQSGWAPGTGGPWFYTEDDYREVVAYAAERYVTVVPEIDGPGHTAAALASVPGLNHDGIAPPPYSGFDVRVSVVCLDPEHLPAVTDFLAATFKEAAELNPGPWMHIGGDEVPTTTDEQFAAYVKAAADAAVANGKRVIGWHQIADGPLPPGSAVQYWGEADADQPTIGTPDESADIRAVRKALAQHAKVVLSPADRAYTDMKYAEDTPYGLQWAGFVPVERAYDWDPVKVLARPDGSEPIVTEEQVLGVEAALWADRAYDGSSSLPMSLEQFPHPNVYIDHMSFPRLPAIAEIGWSAAEAKDWADFRARLAAHGPRWEAAGIGFFKSPEIDWAP